MAKVSDRAVLVYQIERRSRSDCVHEQVAKRIANVRFTYMKSGMKFALSLTLFIVKIKGRM